ncbi:hypothetical protein Tco_0820555 [Tanacetum coccineum]|uniref:Uncharacterized protein n=1 Tax=Tanacetum coccineum TaxID=301880 RepID=A0ABQ5AE07_9ASTR
MMNELVRNQLYDILKQHQNEVNEDSNMKGLAHIVTVYQKQRKAKLLLFAPIMIQKLLTTFMEMMNIQRKWSIDNLMALILSRSRKSTNSITTSTFRTSFQNTSRANQDNSPRINKGTRYDNQRAVNVVGARENVETERYDKDAVIKEKMLLCKQEEAGVQLNAEQADWKDDTDDESEEQELEAHYMYMAQLQEVIPDSVDTSGPIFDDEPLHKVQNNNDSYNVFAMENEHPEQPESKLRMTSETDDLDQERMLILANLHSLNEFTDLQCDYGGKPWKRLRKSITRQGIAIVVKETHRNDERKNLWKLRKPAIFSDSLAKKDFSKSKPVTTQIVSNDFSKPVTTQILPQNMLSIVKNTNMIAPGMYKVHTKPNQIRIPQLHQDIRKPNKRVSFSIGVIPNTSVSRPQLKSNHLEDRVMSNNSQGKKQEVEDHHRKFKFSNNKTSVTACNDSLNAKTLNVNFVCVTYGKCVLNDNHDLCVLHYINGVNSRTKQPMAVLISTREPKQNVNQSVATSSKKTVVTDSTIKKSRNTTRKLYEQVSKTCSWWYPNYTPPGYNWKPKSQKENVNPNHKYVFQSASKAEDVFKFSRVLKRVLPARSSLSLPCTGTIVGMHDEDNFPPIMQHVFEKLSS